MSPTPAPRKRAPGGGRKREEALPMRRTLSITTTPDREAAWRAAAERAGLSLAAWARPLLDAGAVEPPPDKVGLRG